MTVLSINLNKIAVLRNSRGGAAPDIVPAARTCIGAGCGGITVHPRPDLRHVRPDDVRRLAALLADQAPGVEFNLEGNPFAPARGAYPGFVALCREVRPAQATLVPDGDDQITSDHGFDLARDHQRLRPLVAELKDIGCRVSLFMDAVTRDFAPAAAIGADRIELYTGPYAEAHAAGAARGALTLYAAAAGRARDCGLGINAGHDLNQANLGDFLRAVPGVAEVSIGHALIGEALYEGLERTVGNYLAIIAESLDAGVP
jgi:pyridoxine 5-phosphate synthase